ncbi:MAG: alanine dehydrogenase, partial [Burkholderiaceae bacterium]
MLIGLPKEIKNHEYRVGLTPASVRELTGRGHRVLVQAGAGAGIGLTDAQYVAAGASMVSDAADVFAQADMIVKVKEPQPGECAMLRPDQILYTYLHLAPDPEQTAALVKSGAVCIAYETITGPGGGLPLLAPMSEVAGRMSIQAGAAHLEKSKGGMGVLLGGVPGVPAAHVTILGAGVVGTHALQMAVGMGARVTVLDKNVDRLRHLDLVFGNRITTLYSTAHSVEAAVLDADLVIGGVLIPGAAAPKLVSRDLIARMKKGAVVVDVAIDQGGCFETSHAT